MTSDRALSAALARTFSFVLAMSLLMRGTAPLIIPPGTMNNFRSRGTIGSIGIRPRRIS